MTTTLDARHLALAVAAASLLACSGGRDVLPGSGSGGSLVLSLPGIDAKLKTDNELHYRLYCADDKAELAAAISAAPTAEVKDDPNATDVKFTNVDVEKGDFCLLEVVTKDTAKESNYIWRLEDGDGKPRKLVFYRTDAGEVTGDTERSLKVNLYQVYRNKDQVFSAVVTATFPDGVDATNGTASLLCDNQKVFILGEKWEKADQAKVAKISFSVDNAKFANAVSCQIEAKVADKQYKSKAAFDVKKPSGTNPFAASVTMEAGSLPGTTQGGSNKDLVVTATVVDGDCRVTATDPGCQKASGGNAGGNAQSGGGTSAAQSLSGTYTACLKDNGSGNFYKHQLAFSGRSLAVTITAFGDNKCTTPASTNASANAENDDFETKVIDGRSDNLQLLKWGDNKFRLFTAQDNKLTLYGKDWLTTAPGKSTAAGNDKIELQK